MIENVSFQSWEAMDGDTATFTPDITPLILAAHTDNYEVEFRCCVARNSKQPYIVLQFVPDNFVTRV